MFTVSVVCSLVSASERYECVIVDKVCAHCICCLFSLQRMRTAKNHPVCHVTKSVLVLFMHGNRIFEIVQGGVFVLAKTSVTSPQKLVSVRKNYIYRIKASQSYVFSFENEISGLDSLQRCVCHRCRQSSRS